MATEAVVRTLEHLWRILKPLNLPMAVMGGVSLSAWKHRRATYDVDLLIGIDQADVSRLISILQAAGFRAKQATPLVTLSEAEFLQLLYEPPEAFVDIQVDLLLAKSEFEQEALSRRVAMPASEIGIDVDVLSCEDVIILKLFAGRIIDRADVAALLRLNRKTIDSGYLLKWVRKRNLLAEFAEVWNEAVPGEPLPTEP